MQQTPRETQFEETYLQFSPLLRKIALRKFGIPLAEAEPLVHDIFIVYFTHVDEVNNVGGYLVSSMCSAARNHLGLAEGQDALFCGETPCAATPTESILQEAKRDELLLRRLVAIWKRRRPLQ